MRRAARGLVVAVVVAVVALTALRLLLGRDGLPRDIEIVELEQDLTTLDGASVEAPPGAVHVASIQTNPYVDGGYRRSIVAPPPATVRFRVTVPEGGALRFSTGVAREGRRDPKVAGVRFTTRVDGREVHARSVDPARTRHDRRWFDERIDLAAWGGKQVEIVLETRASGDGVVDGTAGWANVRITREHYRARQQASPGAPNVLVLLVDTLRADRLGCYGATPSPSPHVDQLAREGLLFRHAVAQSSWTMPSVATLFTGLHPRSHGVTGGSCLWGKPEGRQDEIDEPACAYLADALPTIAEHAQRAGITTFGVSANPLISHGTNFTRGFETFVEFIPDSQWRNLEGAGAVNRTFLDWVRPNRAHRFFAYLQYVDPHHPYTPPDGLAPAAPAGLQPAVAQGHIDAIARRVNRDGGPLLGAPEIAYLRALYDAEIRSWDAELAALRASLAALGLAESTVIVVTADHGEEFQDHGALLHGTHLYEEQVHVPLIVAGPGIRPGTVENVAQHIDFLPTVARLLGVPPVAGLPGTDLLAAGARDGRAAVSETRHGVHTDGTGIELMSVRQGSWKLIQTPTLGRTELYDLATDPTERVNRYGESAGEPLVRALADFQAAAPAPPRVEGGDARLHQKLRALGYVQ